MQKYPALCPFGISTKEKEKYPSLSGTLVLEAKITQN
jgi:hypothetical protein